MMDFDRFMSNLTTNSRDIILSSAEKDHSEMVKAMNNLLFDKDDPVKFVDQYSPRDRVPVMLFHRLFEIKTVVQNLSDTEIYIRRFPFKDTSITRIRYLRYIFVNYLNEIYLLKQRLKAFLQLVEELYANGLRRKDVRKVTQPLFSYISQMFENIVDARSSHVHKEYYTDRQLEKLEILELTTGNFDLEKNKLSWPGYFLWQYREIRKQKQKQVHEINKSVTDILNTIFSKLYPIVFDENDDVIRVE
jgi:hypothetical protein